jgi:DNA-binding MarR family transcriptional regulator
MYEGLAEQAGLELDPRCTWMLLRLEDHDGEDISTLARLVEEPEPAVRDVVTELVAAGYVEPARGREDDGASGPGQVRLTDTGRSAVAGLVTARRAALDAFVADWGPERHADFAALLNRLVSELSREPSPTP